MPSDKTFPSLGIFQFLIKEGLATIEEVRSADGKLENLYVRCDRNKVLAAGKKSVGKLLVDLQVRKSTADGPGARKFYTDLTTPFDGWDGEYRDIVIAKKQVRDQQAGSPMRSSGTNYTPVAEKDLRSA
jgi:dipeptidyl-peptidase III